MARVTTQFGIWLHGAQPRAAVITAMVLGSAVFAHAALAASETAARAAAEEPVLRAALLSVTEPATFAPEPAAPPAPVRAPEPTAPARDLLAESRARLHSGRATPAAEVDRWTVRLAVDQRAETEAALQRMKVYEPLIRQALTKEGIPQDLLFLPWIESSYLPRATSRVGAAGLWQFMPATARAYGLEVSSYVDERRDPVKATFAAARHLRDLHRSLGSWHLAAAAYNAGSGRVGRSVGTRTKNGDLGFWARRGHLPRETREYVPKLLAAARIGRDPAAYGLRTTPASPLLFREVRVPGGVSLDKVARRVGVPAAALHGLNPHLIRGTTPPNRTWPVRVPADAPVFTGIPESSP